MSDKTKIPWADATWNPITGCTKFSEGCAHCYAERMTKRNLWGYDFTPGTFHHKRMTQPMRWRKPRRVFVGSMGDMFHGAVHHNLICTVMDAMELAKRHTFMLLTKRPYRAAEFFEWADEQIGRRVPDNVWIGTTTENQRWYDVRLTYLQRIISSVLFISAEPLLGRIDMGILRMPGASKPVVDWVICGAETGPGARPMQLDWARSLRDQCAAVGVPFFFKKDSDGNGTLDGVAWHQFPEVAQ